MFLIRPHGQGLASPIRIDESHWNQIRVWDGIGVGDREGVLEDGFDGPPDVDDLVAG